MGALHWNEWREDVASLPCCRNDFHETQCSRAAKPPVRKSEAREERHVGMFDFEIFPTKVQKGRKKNKETFYVS